MTTNQRGFSQIIILALLLTAVGLAVYLVQQRTNLLPQAAKNNTTPDLKNIGDDCKKNGQCSSNNCVEDKCAATSSTNTTKDKTNKATNNTTNNTTSNTTDSTKGDLTKTEITGFKANYDALYAILGSSKDSGNLKIVSNLAKEELDSIVSKLSDCPDDDQVAKCLDKQFSKRFDLAKTAARLSAFYAMFNGVGGVCVKSDFGLTSLITTTSSHSGGNGRAVLCTDDTTLKVWKVFAQGEFFPIEPGNNQFSANPTCESLPANVLAHYRKAEKLFNNEEGFVENTQCDGKTAEVTQATENQTDDKNNDKNKDKEKDNNQGKDNSADI